MVFSTRGRCNDVEQGYKARTKNVFAKSRPVPTFRHFSGMPARTEVRSGGPMAASSYGQQNHDSLF